MFLGLYMDALREDRGASVGFCYTVVVLLLRYTVIAVCRMLKAGVGEKAQ